MDTTNPTRPPLTPQRLRALFDYDPVTGILTRIHPTVYVAGHQDVLGYRRVRIDGGSYLAHRLAWLYVHGRWPADELDHINGIPSDNSLRNLREATRQQNCANGHRVKAVSGARGVYPSRTAGKWVAQAKFAGKARHLGTFETVEEAAPVAEEARIQQFGEFAPPAGHEQRDRGRGRRVTG